MVTSLPKDKPNPTNLTDPAFVWVPEKNESGQETGFGHLHDAEGRPIAYGARDNRQRPHGTWYTYYPNRENPSTTGLTHEVITMHHGLKKGSYCEYYNKKDKNTGRDLLKWDGTYIDNYEEGRWVMYHDCLSSNNKTSCQSRLMYFKHGKRNGLFIRQSQIGNCMERGRYVDDRREGSWNINGKTIFFLKDATVMDENNHPVTTQKQYDAALARLEEKRRIKKNQQWDMRMSGRLTRHLDSQVNSDEVTNPPGSEEEVVARDYKATPPAALIP
jgi:hypothetical protein